MRRTVAVGALAAVATLATGCTEELHLWGARLRGAPVTESYLGDPYYVTGQASASRETCIWVVVQDPDVPDYLADEICRVNWTWRYGSIGYHP